MDYDDNDFQGHNLHLAGEGSSKLSPVLRDYALPKFDFDDSLQGHLRFDSLVENEVFLGIPSQEDNQWIEDFSRGSSGIEFSSSATESCSISRRNNVWSEATSSESVEMLLKSVGQEERILGETIIEESDTGDELGGLTNKMEPNLKQDDKMEDAIHSQPALPPDDFPDGWNESTGAENPTVKCTSEAQIDDPPVYKSFGEVDSHVYSGVIMSEGNVGSDRKCDDNQMEVDSLAKESLVDVKELPSAASGMHIGNTSSSSHNVIASSMELNDQESIYKVTDVCFENVDGLLKQISEGIEEHNVQIKECNMVGQISSGTVDEPCEERNVQIKECNMVGQISSGTVGETCTNNVEDPHGVPSRLGSLVEQKVEINITTLEEPSKLPMKGDYDLQIKEGYKNDVSSLEPSQSCNIEVVVCTEGPEICKQRQGSLAEDSPVACLADGSPKRQAIEVGKNKVACPELDIGSVEEKEKDFGGDQMDSLEGQNDEVGNTKGGSSFCPELEIGSVVEKEKFHGCDNEMDRRVLMEASVLPVIDHNLVEQGHGSDINHVGDLSSLTVACSSAKLVGEQSSNQNLSDVNNTPRVHKEEFLPEGHMPLMPGESMQPNKEILSSEQVGVHSCDQDVPFHERENAKLPAESSDMQCRVVGSLCPDEFSDGNIVTTHGSEFNSSTGNEPESNIVVKDKNLPSCDKLNGLPMFPGTGATADEVTSHNQCQKSPVLGVSSMGTDETEEMVVEVHKDASLSGLNKSLQMATDVEPVPEGPVSEDGKASQRDQAAVQECSKKLEVCLKQVEGTEAAGCENYKEKLMKRNAEVELVEVTAVLSNKIVTPAEAISVSMVESCCQKDHEIIVASGTQTTGQIGPSTKVDLSDESQASVALACPSKCVTDCMNEDGDNSDNLVKDNCESPTVISCTELLLSEKGQQGAIKQTTVDSVLHSEATPHTGEKVKSASLQMGKDASKEERSFTFEVRLSGLSEGETGKSWQSSPSGQVHKISTNDEGSPLTSGHSQIDLKMVPEISHGNAQASVGVITHEGVKGTPERKTRRGSGKAAARQNAKKGNHVKETTPLRQSEKVDKAMMFMGSPGTGQIVQFEELKSCGDVERNVTKTCGVLPIPTSNLPDLNTSVPPAAFFQQPFTDLQQVQLRAQILVYGSLIQESLPDEACMISAFGPSEGGGNLWEPAWRAYIEKVRGQKSHASNSETPVQSRSGSKAADQLVKNSSLQSKVLSSPAGRASSKGIPSPTVNPIIPLSSPLWNVSSPSCDVLQTSSMSRGLLDYHQPLSPLHPYQATGIRNFVGHSPSWLSQTPFPGPWVASPQTSPFDVNARFSVFPNTEPVKLTPAKDPSVPNFSVTKHASLPAVANGGGGASVSSGTSSQPDVKRVTVSSSEHSADPKPRKRKKVPPTEGLGQFPLPNLSQTASASGPGVGNRSSKKAPVPEVAGQKSLLAQSQTDTVPTAIVNNLSSMSVAGATPACFVSMSNSSKYPSALSLTSLTDQPRRVDQNVEKKSIISDETLNTVEEAKLQAETAASHAAAAVGRCHDVWSQLDNQKSSGLTSDVEAKLTSAAMAIAAAVSVAKAAAAAAKIASDVAVQAKLMAEEVSVSSTTVNSTRSTAISLSNVPNSSWNATPSSILKDGNGSAYPSSIIAVAREAARKRVEAASAASKHAENLDAIVKAAELAAEAVSQAGKIVSIGDPLPLSKLLESGPVDYWKSPQGSPEKGAKSHTLDGDQPKMVGFEELHNVSAEQSKVGPSVMEEVLKPGVASFEKDSFRAQRGSRASKLAKNICVVPESETGSRSASVIAEDLYTSASGTPIENGMKEGCLVEVFKDGGNCKAAWYSANILNLNDGKAFVCYTELQADEGSRHLKEWVSLQGDGIKAPKIRIAHPATTMRFDGTRKRRRVAMMDYTWSVGDKIDAWMQDCWCEGIVKEKNKNDETTLTIHFPALEDTSVVRAWHLRPTLTWQDGEWIEWSSARQQSPSQIQGDTPQEKRVKSGSSTVEAKGMDQMSRDVDLVESKKHEESRPLPLSASEKEFNVGKNTRQENKIDAQRTVRTGLQKEGSRVVFGVPKPGKKRKFMDVSKHFDSDQSNKNINTNDSVKFARYLMPQGSGSRGWKNNTKIDVKERQAAEDKAKVLRSGKPPSASVRALPQKDNFLTSAKSAPHDATTKDQIPEDVISNEEKISDHQNLMEFESFSNSQDPSEGPTLVSSLGLPLVAPKKVLSSNIKSERLNKGKLAASGGRLNKKVEPQDKLIPEVVEPRRSNRKIQPTSRLLEGLQSSLIISKMPSVPHDKSQRSQNRSNIKGNTNHG